MPRKKAILQAQGVSFNILLANKQNIRELNDRNKCWQRDCFSFYRYDFILRKPKTLV